MFHTENDSWSQRWRAYWIDSTHGAHLLWEGFIEPNGSQTLDVTYDEGSGHCPGTLIGEGERIGYDTPTNIVANSESGTRNLDDPGNQADDSASEQGDTSTNGVNQGDLGKLLTELKGIAKERTQQQTTNALGVILDGIVSANQKLSLVNGQLGRVTNQLDTANAKLDSSTNLLSQIKQILTNSLTTQMGISNNTRAPVDFAEYTNRTSMGRAEANTYEAALAGDPWAGSFSNAAGVWAGPMGSLDSAGANTNGIPGDMVGSDPDPEHDWFDWTQPALKVCNVAGVGAWSWALTPELPSESGPFLAVLAFCRLVWAVGITFLLWWRIRSDIQDRLMQLAQIPQASAAGTNIMGVELGAVGRIIASASLIAIFYTFGAHLIGWATGYFTSGGWNALTWSAVQEAAESGSVGGFVSIWLPRVLSWVAMAFPFSLAFGAISMEVTYHCTRDAALRIAIAAVKRAGGFLVIPLLFGFSVSANASTLADCGSAGRVHIAATGCTNAIAVNIAGSTWELQTLGAPGGDFFVPTAGLVAIQVGPNSNYLANLGLFDGSTITVVNAGNDCLVTRPDAIRREEALLKWGTAGLGIGVFFAIVSLYGWIWKRGLFPTGGNWGGDA